MVISFQVISTEIADADGMCFQLRDLSARDSRAYSGAVSAFDQCLTFRLENVNMLKMLKPSRFKNKGKCTWLLAM